MNSKSKVILLIVFILLILIKGYLFSKKYVSDEKEKEYTVFIENLKKVSDSQVVYNVKLLNTSDKFILNIYDNSYDNIKTDLSYYSSYKYGDVIKVKGKISVPELLNNPGEFNYKQYLYSNNIHGLINTYENPEQIPNELNFIENIYGKIYMFKGYIKELIVSSMSGTNAELAISMIYGDTTNLDEEIESSFESIGVSHLMSVSGTHLTSFMLIINVVLGIKKKQKKYKKNNKIKNIIKAIVQIISVCMYIVFTGFSVSVLRAGIMLIIYIVCDALKNKNNKYKAMGIAFLIILIHRPYVIFNTGLKLSFLATLGIIMFSKYITRSLSGWVYKIKNKVLNKTIFFLIQNIAITITVQLMVIPIQIEAFNNLTFPAIIPNLLMGIVSIPIRIIGTIGIMLSFMPSIASKLFFLVEVFVELLLVFSKILNNISLKIPVVSQPNIFFVIYYLCVFCIFIQYKLKDINNKAQYSFSKLLKCLKISQTIMVIAVLIIIISTNIYSIYFSEYAYFFNVEQGDMSYIKCGQESIIVDIGSQREGLAFNTISNYFRINNLNKVDAIVISHMHKDHLNGIHSFLQNYKVGIIIVSKPKTENTAYIEFKQMLNNYNVKVKEVKTGDVINIGKIKLEVMLPGEEYITEDEVNANSLICKIKVKDKCLLYMGDASKEAEQKLIKENKNLQDVYILKVGHHGSKTATCKEFIQKIKAQNAVISALKKYYGHPHQDTIETLKQCNVHTYLTEKQGAIKFGL